MANGQGPGVEQFKTLLGNPDEMNSLNRIRRERDLAAQKVENEYRNNLEKQEARLNKLGAKNAEAAKRKAIAQQGGKILAGEIEGATGQAAPVDLQPGPSGLLANVGEVDAGTMGAAAAGGGHFEFAPEASPEKLNEQMLANMADLGIDPKDPNQSAKVDLFQRAHRENMAQRQPYRRGITGFPQIDQFMGVLGAMGIGPGGSTTEYMPPQSVTSSQMRNIEEADKQVAEAELTRTRAAAAETEREKARKHAAKKRIWEEGAHEHEIKRRKQEFHLTDLQIKDEEAYNVGAKEMVDSLSPTGGDGQKIPDRISPLRAEGILRSEGGRTGELNKLNAASSNITNAVPTGTNWEDVAGHSSNRFMQAFIKDNATTMSAVSNGEIFMFSGDFGPDILGQSKEEIFSDESKRPYRSKEMSVLPLQPRFNQIIHSSSEAGAKNYAMGEFFGDIVGSHYIGRYGLTKEWRELSENFIDKNGEFNTKAFGKFKNAMIKQGQHGNAKSLNLLFGQLIARTKDASEEQRNIDLRPSVPTQEPEPEVSVGAKGQKVGEEIREGVGTAVENIGGVLAKVPGVLREGVEFGAGVEEGLGVPLLTTPGPFGAGLYFRTADQILELMSNLLNTSKPPSSTYPLPPEGKGESTDAELQGTRFHKMWRALQKDLEDR
tara:strand:- start:5443 stop:7425 length:1983 start_codon:yes stop_codon:yes gene_type:complete